MIGIIAAMQEELDEVVSLATQVREETLYGVKFYCGFLEEKEVVMMLSGIAKVNATFSTSLLLQHYPVDHVINVGSAGGLKMDQRLLDVVVSTHVAQHDLDVGRARGELGGQPRFIYADETLVRLAKDLAIEGVNVHQGLIVSGDQFIVSKATQDIMTHFPDAFCVEMEASAVAQVCYRMQVPFVIIRSISDLPYEVDNGLTFVEYLPKAARHSALITRQLVQKI